MKCPLCGLEFDESEVSKACSGCHISRSCNLVRCPNCGYESPIEPKFIKKIKQWRSKKNDSDK
jgi:uncharacterized Zn finger protein